MSRQKTLVILLIILILGAVLRLWGLETTPPSLNQDEAVNGVDAFAIGMNLRDHHGNFLPPMLQSFNDWASPTLTYLTVPFVKVFGLSIWSVRLASSLIGIALIPLIFWLVNLVLGHRESALFAAFVVAISPFAISLSRWAIPPSIVPTLLALFLALLFWSANQVSDSWRSWLGFTSTALAGAALTYSYPTMKVFAPLLVGVVCLVYFRKFWKQMILLVGLFTALVSPIYYLTLTQPEIYNARYDSVGVTARGESYIDGFNSRFWDYFSPLFLTGDSDTNPMHHVPGFGPIPELFTLLIYLGLIIAVLVTINYESISDKVKIKSVTNIHQNLSILILAFLTFPIAPSLTVDKVILTRGIQGLLLAIVFAAIGFWYIWHNIDSIKIKRFLGTGILVISLFSTFQFSHYYFGQYSQNQKSNFQYGIRQMLVYLQQNDSQFDKVEIADINQPYIYKLFFEPRNFDAINPKTMDRQIGKYYFGGVNKAGLSQKTIIKTIEDEMGQTWFNIYEFQPRWYIVVRP